MTYGEQVEAVAKGGFAVIPSVGTGIGLGILISIIPVVLMSIGLKITNAVFYKVVE
tara:strand:- start:572 stop:739 length:168 start_codon:yes stop_codon:yes gene_type:complete